MPKVKQNNNQPTKKTYNIRPWLSGPNSNGKDIVTRGWKEHGLCYAGMKHSLNCCRWCLRRQRMDLYEEAGKQNVSSMLWLLVSGFDK